jgi:hypothetical protein
MNLYLSFFMMFFPLALGAVVPDKGRISDEIESLGGHSLGFGNEAMAALTDLSSIRANPAMMSLEKQYQIGAGYHWPSLGRDFYQIGVVDSKTAQVAMGVLYTSAQKPYIPFSSDMKEKDDRVHAYFDSPIKKRFAFGAAYSLETVALGAGGQYIEFYDLKDQTKKKQQGTTLALGLAGLLTPTLRFGLSGENLSGRDMEDVAPKTYRAGLAYTTFGGILTLHGDWKNRERVAQELAPLDGEGLLPTTQENKLSPEQTLGLSMSVKIQDLLRLVGGYSQSLDRKNPRQALAGGIALVQSNYSLSYLIHRPYMKKGKNHQAIQLAINMSL